MQTVKELIQELQKYPDNLKVLGVAKHDGGGFWCPVEIQQAIGVNAMDGIVPYEFEMPFIHIILDIQTKKA